MTDISGSNTVSDGYNGLYTPTTEEVRNTDSAKPWTPTTQYVVERYADDWQGGTSSERVAQFDRWLAEVKAQAWDRGYEAGLTDFASSMTTNPYRQGETE